MLLRSPWVVKTAGLAGACGLSLWMKTLQYRYRSLGPEVDPFRAGRDRRFIYAMWHENILLPLQRFARSDICVLISRHRDAEVIAEACRFLRVQVVRGSTARGGVGAVRELLQTGGRSHLAFAADGPRGPRRQVQPGLIYLAAQLNLPIVPVGFGFHRPWRARSWDRFVLPRPWARARCVAGIPIVIPSYVDRDQLEEHRQTVEERLASTTTIAESWADSASTNHGKAA